MIIGTIAASHHFARPHARKLVPKAPTKSHRETRGIQVQIPGAGSNPWGLPPFENQESS